MKLCGLNGYECDFDKPYDKNDVFNQYIEYQYMRTQSMFHYTGLPDTIPQSQLELLLQINGTATIAEVDGKLYAFRGGLGGEPDAYYRPTKSVVANPALKLSKSYTINEDCVLMRNDIFWCGLMPMFKRYSRILSENLTSLNVASIVSRLVDLISASDDITKQSAEKFIKDLTMGKLSIIGEPALIDSLKSQPANKSANNSITQLIELHQYIKASWFNELGLNANYNMKREAINSDESQLNTDALLPLIDHMLNCRKEDVQKINDMFGTSISVFLSSSWEDVQIEENSAHEENEEGEEDDLSQNE